MTAGCRRQTMYCHCADLYITSFNNCDRSLDAAKMVVQAFISSGLDYCNSLVCGIVDNLLHKLRSVQNAAAQLITRTSRWERITPFHGSCTGYQFNKALTFKLAILMYKALHGQLLQYLAEDCQLLTDIGCRLLRLADIFLCVTRRTRTCLGVRNFAIAGLCLWNSLSLTLRASDTSLVQFKRLANIKTE